jgi:hypothetical protein
VFKTQNNTPMSGKRSYPRSGPEEWGQVKVSVPAAEALRHISHIYGLPQHAMLAKMALFYFEHNADDIQVRIRNFTESIPRTQAELAEHYQFD